MKVREAVKALLDKEQDADLVICAHEWEPGRGWHVDSFESLENGSIVLVEGAAPLTSPDSSN